MASVQFDNRLYIQGGYSTTNYTPQLDAIDLSQSWPISTPAWISLKDGPPISHHTLVPVTGTHAKSISTTGEGFILSIAGDMAPSFWSAIDLKTWAWTSITDIPAPYPTLQGHAAVSDPNTGYIYVIGGYSNNATYNTMTVLDPTTKTIVSQQSATAASSLTDIGAIWSTVRKTIMIFGGSRAPPAPSSGLDMSNLNEYDPVTQTWKTVVTSDGSKIILFGGSLDTKTYFSTIYIFDVKTLEWTLGQPAADFRTRMACGFHAGQFIAWGGSSGDNRVTTMHSNIPIVYDLALNTWVDKYNSAAPEVPTGTPPPPSTSPPTSSSPSSGSSTPSESKKSNGPMIGGIVVGVLAMIAGLIILFIVLKRKRRERREKAYARAVASSIAGDDDDRPYANNPLYMNMCSTDDSNFGRKVLAGAYLHDSKTSLPEHYTSTEPLRTNRQRFESPSAASTDTFVGTSDDYNNVSSPICRSRPNSESIQDYARRSNIGQSGGGPMPLSSSPLPPPVRNQHQQRSSGNYKPLSPPISPFESGLNPGRGSFDQGSGVHRSGFSSPPGKRSFDSSYENPTSMTLRPPENQQQAPYRPMRESVQVPPRPPRESLDVPARPREAALPFRPRDPFQKQRRLRDSQQPFAHYDENYSDS
ncbi:hypothetical protein BGX28_001866 [Mortierella sp. GBA30]|nr:hypothetical protein BGX28_001866 [Mortierella sp. GBA30]